MLRALKDWLKDSLPYPVLIRLYYLYYWLVFLPRYEMGRRRGGFSRLGGVDLSRYKSSDTLFVMASGPSINRIPEQRWRAIRSADSFGFNFWPYHSFVPTMYFFESTTVWHGTDAASVQEAWAQLLALLRRRAADYRNVLKVVMDLAKPGHQSAFDVAPEFRENLYCAYSVVAAARTDDEFTYALRYLKSWGVFRPRFRTSFLFKHAATLSTLVALGAVMGYRKIVLCGVDMNDLRRFYQDPKLYPDTAGTDFYRIAEEKKMTFFDRFAWGHTPIDVVLLELKRQVLEPAGIQLYVENPGSALCPRIPAAPESLFDDINARTTKERVR